MQKTYYVRKPTGYFNETSLGHKTFLFYLQSMTCILYQPHVGDDRHETYKVNDSYSGKPLLQMTRFEVSVCNKNMGEKDNKLTNATNIGVPMKCLKCFLTNM